MRPQLEIEFLKESFEYSQSQSCFWCGKKITKFSATLEHLLSKGYCRLNSIKYNEKDNFRLSCYECNHLRGRITLLYVIALKLRKGKQVNNHEYWKYRRSEILLDMDKFMRKIKEDRDIKESIRYKLLDEINTVLTERRLFVGVAV